MQTDNVPGDRALWLDPPLISMSSESGAEMTVGRIRALREGGWCKRESAQPVNSQLNKVGPIY